MRKYLFSLLILGLGPGLVYGSGLNVLILRRAPEVHFSFWQPYTVFSEGKARASLTVQDRLTAKTVAGGVALFVSKSANEQPQKLGVFSAAIEIKPTAVRPAAEENSPLPKFVTFRQPTYGGDITYSGPLTLFAKNGVNVVESVALEEYVTQVVNCELGGEKTLAALKAQSVLVRTFALYITQLRLLALEKGNQNWAYFQLFATPVDQAYNCRKRANDREPPNALVRQAVKETADEVLLKNNKLARVQYNTCAAQPLPKGVICQETMMKMARQGKSYQEILSFFRPDTHLAPYQKSDFYTQIFQHLLQQKLQK